MVAFLLLAAGTALAGGGPENVLVVVNGNDADSIRVGEYYANARHLPPGNLLRLDVPVSLTTDFDTYRNRIQEPIKTYLAQTGLRAHVDYLVLTKGLPILTKVPGGSAAVTACLMVMDTPVCGQRQTMPLPTVKSVVNPFVGVPRAFSHRTKYGEYHLYLATMLTGYTAEDAIALVDRALAAEKAGPPADPLFVFQDASGNAGGRNRFYAQAMKRLTDSGFRAEHYPNGGKRVTGKKRVMGYMSGGSYSQLTEEGIRSNEYLPGAICDMLESFGAVPQNFDPARKSQVPVTWFVRHGITGVHGAVAEPFAHTFPDVLLFQRYAAGMNMAEAFHASIPFLYWKNLVIGDPLCTPFVRRPAVKIEGPLTGHAAGTVKVVVSTAGGDVRGVRIFVDGLLRGEANGTRAEFALDTTRLADGEHHLLAAAVLPPPLLVQGFTAATLTVRNPSVAPLAARKGPEGSLLVTLSRPVSPAGVKATIEGRPAAVAKGPGRSELRLAPPFELLAGKELTVSLSGAATGTIPFLVPPHQFLVTGPDTVRAGEEVQFRILAEGSRGNPATAYRGHVTVSLSQPPVTAAEIDAETPALTAKIRLQKAGLSRVLVLDRVTGARGERQVHVTPGDPAGFTVSPGSCPVGRPVNLTVRLLDRYGNATTGYSGRLMLATPGDLAATIPSDADAKNGVAVFPGVVFTKPGRHLAVVRDAAGNTLGQGMVRVEVFTERSWLVLGPLAKPPAGTDPSPSEGRLSSGGLWKRYESPRNEVDLRRALGAGKGIAYAHLYVSVPADTKVRISLGWGSKITLFVDGKEVFAAKKAEKKTKRDRQVLRGFELEKGWHRLLVRSEHGGVSDRFILGIASESGGPIEGLSTSLSAPGKPGRIEGRITSQGKGVAGMEIALTGSATVRTRTLRDGRFLVGGLPPGTYRVVPQARGLAATPPSREVKTGTEPATGVDFTVKDEIPPEVAIESPADGAKGGDELLVVVKATDNVGVSKVWVAHDGARVGAALTKAPWRFTLRAADLGYRTLRLTAFAVDGAGNRTESRPIRVRLIRDRRGPSIRLLHPRSSKAISSRTRFEVQVTDEVGVAAVEFLLDGKSLGKPLSAPKKGTADRYEVVFDPTSVRKGTHTLVVRARDPAGNESKRTVRFRTK